MIRKSSICFQWTYWERRKVSSTDILQFWLSFSNDISTSTFVLLMRKALILSSHIIYHVGGVSREFHLHFDFLWMQQQCLFTRVSRPTPAILLNQIQPNAIFVVSLSSVHCTHPNARSLITICIVFFYALTERIKRKSCYRITYFIRCVKISISPQFYVV